jgi:hypothetical protein
MDAEQAPHTDAEQALHTDAKQAPTLLEEVTSTPLRSRLSRTQHPSHASAPRPASATIHH